MSAMCMGRAVRRAQTLRAPTPAAVWRATCCSQTTAPAKPKMVRTHTQTQSAVQTLNAELICFSVGNDYPIFYT